MALSFKKFASYPSFDGRLRIVWIWFVVFLKFGFLSVAFLMTMSTIKLFEVIVSIKRDKANSIDLMKLDRLF